jgi:cytochrome c
MKKLTFALTIAALAFFASCGGGDSTTTSEAPAVQEEVKADPRGVGPNMEVTLTDPLDETMMANGKTVYEMKCASCHKLDGNRVVGPGFSGVTNRRKPEWIMNMITNTDVMLEKDPTAQALLEECLTRMPNQNLSTRDAREVLEFLRNNDVQTIGKKDEAVNS